MGPSILSLYCYDILLLVSIVQLAPHSTPTGIVAHQHNYDRYAQVHQPAYRNWALLSLDTVGFSSEAWLREHLMQVRLSYRWSLTCNVHLSDDAQ